MERVEGMEGVEGKMIASVLAKAIPIDPSITLHDLHAAARRGVSVPLKQSC
jgi:hypothetical protein